MLHKILIVDDEPNIARSFSSLLADHGLKSDTVGTAEDAATFCQTSDPALILLDLNLPGQSGIDFLKRLSGTAHSPVVLVISGQGEINTALEAIKLGACDYLEKPVPPEKLIASVQAALRLAEAQRQRLVMVDQIDAGSNIVGDSPPIRELLATIAQVAPTDTTVLVEGENGTGKELIAARLYLQSKRRDKPFVKVNCPGIPETLFESELFGHKRGSFTGAVKDHPGKFMLADNGTIFLDEIGDLPASCQAKLLRVLETGEVETLGDSARKQVDVRVIAATNRNLQKLVSDGHFREDLYYRISVFSLRVPPLRERTEDIPLLVGEFLKRFDPSGKTTLSPDALAYLCTLEYPGNVRQLKNHIERLCILSREQTIQFTDAVARLDGPSSITPTDADAGSLTEKLRIFERLTISNALTACEGNIAEAARLLGVDRGNLSRKIKEYGLKGS